MQLAHTRPTIYVVGQLTSCRTPRTHIRSQSQVYQPSPASILCRKYSKSSILDTSPLLKHMATFQSAPPPVCPTHLHAPPPVCPPTCMPTHLYVFRVSNDYSDGTLQGHAPGVTYPSLTLQCCGEDGASEDSGIGAAWECGSVSVCVCACN